MTTTMTTTDDRRNRKRRHKRLVERIENKGPRWHSMVAFISAHEREDERKLVLTLVWLEDKQHYHLGAAEAGTVDTPQDFFDDHGHDDLGDFDSEAEAKQAAKDYLLAWLRHELPMAACDCDAIGDKAQPATRSELPLAERART